MQANQQQSFHKKLIKLNDAYIQVFNDYGHQSQLINRKYTASIVSEAYGLLQQGTTEQRNKTKEFFLKIFREFIEYFIQSYILRDFTNNNERQLLCYLIERWRNFKKFTFLYYTIFQYAHNHYESAFKSYQNQGKINRLQKSDSIFPIASVSLHYFSTMVYNKYREIIHRQIRKNLALQRQQQTRLGTQQKQNSKILLEIVYSCGLREMARIGSSRGINNEVSFEFFKVKNLQIIKKFENDQRNSQDFIDKQILSAIIKDSQEFYSRYYTERLSILSPIDDFLKVTQIVNEQEQKSEFYFFTILQKQQYLNVIKKCLIFRDLDSRLRRQNSLKHYLQIFTSQSPQYLNQIHIFIKAAFKIKKLTLPIIQNIIKDHLIDHGQKLTEKINKRKQYIADAIFLRKSIGLIIDQAMDKELRICIVRDKCFRKILDSIEASRNLAEYTDSKIKQCIKNKLNDEDAFQRIKEIFLILENLAATDSFLIYHQQMLGKRLIDPINEPKTQIQYIFLKKLGEKLGSISVSPHINMIKDIQQSQQLTQKFNKNLPFCNFRWNCRVISQPFWPDYINRIKLQITFPQVLRVHAETVAEMFHEINQFRYLKWKSQKGFSLFEGKFKTGKYRFQCQNLFMLLLFHINQGKNHQIIYGNLCQKVVMNKESDNQFLMKCVGVLVQNGLVIRDVPQEAKMDKYTEGQLLKINENYKPKDKIKPNQVIIVKASPQMHKAMHMTTIQHGKILREREKIVEAVLVKLLKHSHSTGNNSITFQQLYQGIKSHSHLGNFQFPQSAVKQRLQELIHRGYCQRDQNDRKIYHYIA